MSLRIGRSNTSSTKTAPGTWWTLCFRRGKWLSTVYAQWLGLLYVALSRSCSYCMRCSERKRGLKGRCILSRSYWAVSRLEKGFKRSPLGGLVWCFLSTSVWFFVCMRVVEFVGVDTDLLRMKKKKNWQYSVRTSDREQNIQTKARPIKKCLVIFPSSLATHAARDIKDCCRSHVYPKKVFKGSGLSFSFRSARIQKTGLEFLPSNTS